MKKMFRKLMSLMLSVSVMILSIHAMPEVSVYGANSTVKIFYGESDTASHHKTLLVNVTSEDFSYKLKGYTAKSAKYESTNEKSFKIISADDGKCKIEPIKEGTGHLILTIKTTEGEIFEEKVFISVYTRITASLRAEIINDADVYRGASRDAEVENGDDKGDLAKGTKVDITATCEDFYIFRTLDGTTFKDGQNTGFIEKKNVKINVASVVLNESIKAVEKGKEINLTATVTPELANNKNVNWSSSNNEAVTVDNSGKVTCSEEGYSVITATSDEDSNIFTKCEISIYTLISELNGYAKEESKLYKTSGKTNEAGIVEKKQSLIVVGTSGTCYMVKTDSGKFFIEKSKVIIPVSKITLDKTNLTKVVGKKFTLKATVIPEGADNVDVQWLSSNSSIAVVDVNGNVTAKKEGTVNIIAKAKDGDGAQAVCVLKVIKKGTLRITYGQSSFKSKKITLTWNKVKNAIGYEVWGNYRSGDDYRLLKKINDSNVTEWTSGKLKYDVVYNYQVFPIGEDSDGKFKMDPGYAPSITINRLKLLNKTNTKVYLKWGKIKDADGYTIYKYNKKNKKYKKIKNVTETSYIVTKLKANTKYKFKVRAYEVVNGKKQYFKTTGKKKVKTYGKTNGYFSEKVNFSKE